VVNGALNCLPHGESYGVIMLNEDHTPYKSKIIGDHVSGTGAAVSILSSNNGGTSWTNIMTCSTSRVQIFRDLWCNGTIYAGSTSIVSLSDDRLKINEKLITDASGLLKLRPQVYHKMKNIGGDPEKAVFEAGLIAQEVWYDAPEFRHLVSVGEGGSPADAIATSDDPTVDPDYSSWGTNPASIGYTGFIPYLIRGFQEHSAENTALKEKVENLEAQIAMLMKASGLVDSGNVES
jgi:hypothetical protein